MNAKKTQKKKDEAKKGKDHNKELDDVLQEKQQLFEQLQRVSADYANFQKRAPKQISDTIAYEKERIMKSLLPALDNFEHTIQKSDSAENVEVLVQGVRIIYDQMLDILKSHNVEQIHALDQDFDPALHQAIMQRHEPDKEEGIVLEEFQKGYKLNDRVIRPSQVIVNKQPAQIVEPQEQDEQPDAMEDEQSTAEEGNETENQE